MAGEHVRSYTFTAAVRPRLRSKEHRIEDLENLLRHMKETVVKLKK